MDKTENSEQLNSFTRYCLSHPQERFWQALRNWDRINNYKTQFVLVAEALDLKSGKFVNIRDTFYD